MGKWTLRGNQKQRTLTDYPFVATKCWSIHSMSDAEEKYCIKKGNRWFFWRRVCASEVGNKLEVVRLSGSENYRILDGHLRSS